MPNTILTPTSIIAKKRDQEELTRSEIQYMIDGFTTGAIPDYQMSAWAMAIVCRGMSPAEIVHLTDAMISNGSTLARATERPRVDKHSTGGLGDKVSLVLAPLIACFDCDVPMLSGRGLGITGGTLDKLEAYAGYNSHLSESQIIAQLRDIGCVITGTTTELAPADRKLYSLRDATATVPSIALITGSIMSKKLAASLDALILDVKFGSGAFMPDVAQARQLADSLVNTGRRLGLITTAVLSDMNQPLGTMVGNSCEANEAVEVLRGGGPSDVRQLSLHLAAELLVSAQRFDSIERASTALAQALDAGYAYQRFEAMVAAQQGQFREQLPTAEAYELVSPTEGWLARVDGQCIGRVVINLGGGRIRLNDSIDHAVGLQMLVRIGDRVERNQPLVRVFARSPNAADSAKIALLQGLHLNAEPTPAPSLIVDSQLGDSVGAALQRRQVGAITANDAKSTKKPGSEMPKF